MGVGMSLWATFVTFFIGTGIPVLGPIAIAAGVAAITTGLYLAVKGASPESRSAAAHDAMIKAIDAWADPNKAGGMDEDAKQAVS